MPFGGIITGIITTTSIACISPGSVTCITTDQGLFLILGRITTARPPFVANRAPPPIAARTGDDIRVIDSLVSRARCGILHAASQAPHGVGWAKQRLRERAIVACPPLISGWEWWARREGAPLPTLQISLRGDAHFLHHAGVFGELFASEGTELLGRTAAYGEAQIFQFGAHFRIGQRL
jgi:hypothetical protein